jgi:hypothetical protein
MKEANNPRYGRSSRTRARARVSEHVDNPHCTVNKMQAYMSIINALKISFVKRKALSAASCPLCKATSTQPTVHNSQRPALLSVSMQSYEDRDVVLMKWPNFVHLG